MVIEFSTGEAIASPTRREAVITLALLAITGSTPALAHAHLVSASPAVDSTVRTAPREVSISFTEKLEEKLSSITVKDAAGRRFDKGAARFADTSGKKLLVALSELAPGRYTVDWVAASVDTHGTNGSFAFTVRP